MSHTATPIRTPSPEIAVRFRSQDGMMSTEGANLGGVRVGAGRWVLESAATATVRSHTRWSLSVTTSGPLTNRQTGRSIPLQRFQWRLSGEDNWTPFRNGSSLVLRDQPRAPNGRAIVFDYSVIVAPTDRPGRYSTGITYTVSAAP